MFLKRKGRTIKLKAMDELEGYVEVYGHFRNDIATLTKHDHFDLIEETVLTRASIHDCLAQLPEVDERVKLKILDLDKQWQGWVTKNKQEDFALVDIDQSTTPKTEWWFWIDRLDELTPEERSTL